MHRVAAYSSLPLDSSNIVDHAQRFKQHDEACFESSPPPSDLGFGKKRLSVDGLDPNLLHLAGGGNVPPPVVKQHHQSACDEWKRPQPALRIGRHLLLDQLDSSGTLYKSVNTENQEELACKVISKRDSQKVLSAHYRLDAEDRINELQEVVVGETKTYMFFPRSHGDLYLYVRTRRRLRETEARDLFRQVAVAVARCHENGVMLRDLKLRKFVFKDVERTQLKLESLEDAVTFDDDDDSVADKHGCPAYISPEILTASDRYSGCAADMWSLGVMLYTMLVGRYPFHDPEPSVLFAKIRRAHLVVPEWLSSKARCLIRALLRPNPAERFTAADVLAHPWLRPGQTDFPTSYRYENRLPDQTVPSGVAITMFEPASIRRTK